MKAKIKVVAGTVLAVIYFVIVSPGLRGLVFRPTRCLVEIAISEIMHGNFAGIGMAERPPPDLGCLQPTANCRQRFRLSRDSNSQCARPARRVSIPA
jgi:hypothetical protein